MKSVLPVLLSLFFVGISVLKGTQSKPQVSREQEEFGQRLMIYYRQPSPELAAELLKGMDLLVPQLPSAINPMVAFGFKLFQANPERGREWLGIIAGFRKNLPLRKSLLLIAPAANPKLKKEVRRLLGRQGKTMKFPTAEEIEKFLRQDPDRAWSCWFATGKKDYPLAVLKIALEPAREPIGQATTRIDLTAASARWSLLALSKQQPEVMAIVKEYFATAPQREINLFFKDTKRGMQRQFLTEGQMKDIPRTK